MSARETLRERIKRKLTAAFQPSELELIDDSARHEGHQPDLQGAETHFKLRMISTAFNGMSSLERQRAVYAVLADEMKLHIHALSMDLQTPEQ
jgi:BolA protein